ncbi:MAG: TrpB-like pyridoxal phosphate-dependent enzyme [Anaerolineae bacterium]|uniref:TrpB-like pyridoxal phosphate-dependent enzyme n=1 Tax=Promineifilum sp. TaxID=2664178 RepID=UPI001D3ACC81|nr:TrpB-like pyridoxal phosphate-dependent enzyme [Anaerolineales bacterium]MCB8935352.1 TrpB-like pyridoxal phosphate-dependent enzyme [Promineifilum sp.]MCO5182122.1 TrpB-like pyridoxal phosphate-dependent enzyme [Promineifilum sp.]MCW5846541.1 TrpB-like pyridoxal phosphate-dependent enzyme [Anaerolineae bacterium]
MTEQTKFLLDESKLPKAWYNINADMPTPPQPVLHPGTLEPVTPDFLAVLFPMALILQEISTERYIEIPEPVREIYKLWRPTPFIRARRLEQALDTPAHIYFKYEGVSPVGSHKPNTAVPQAFYNKEAGTKALTTETGAGQWGSALAMACSFFDMALEVYMVKESYHQKPYRRIMIESYGAQVYASPSNRTQYGRSLLAEDVDAPGSLGIAISEAVEAAATSDGAKKYSLGSVLNHVLMHQTVIGQETLLQFEMADEYPDVIVGCTGGGSNFAGFAFPFIHKNLTEGKSTRVIAAEPAASPSLTKGVYTFDYGDTAQMAPVVKMHTLGHTFIPPGIHAGGLRYHGMAPQVSALVDGGYVEARAVKQRDTFQAALTFLRAEGIIPAPESTHAIKVAIDEALAAKAGGEKRVVAFNLSGHGHFDMAAYESYLHGNLEDYEYPAEAVEEALQHLPRVA